jgi:hypothetical protein
MEHEQFTQFLQTKKVYHVDHLHLDGSDLPTIAQPQWSVTHQGADGNATASIATLETSVDGFSGRLTAHMVGVVTITVTAVVSPTAVATKTFQIAVKEHPPVSARSPAFTVSQHRNSPI